MTRKTGSSRREPFKEVLHRSVSEERAALVLEHIKRVTCGHRGGHCMARAWTREFYIPRYFMRKTTLEHDQVFETLQELRDPLGLEEYALAGFQHPDVPIVLSVRLALMHRTIAMLEWNVREHARSTPRDELYAAFKLGLVGEEQFRTAPPYMVGRRCKPIAGQPQLL